MKESESRREKSREWNGFGVSFARTERNSRAEKRTGLGMLAACVALLRHGIAEIAAVRSSPRLGREEEKE
jgi:hypothetical protein